MLQRASMRIRADLLLTMVVTLSLSSRLVPCERTIMAGQVNSLACKTCGKIIQSGSHYLKTPDGAVFCNNRCFEEILPVCSACGKRASKSVAIKGQSERVFCKECAEKDRCFCCGMPDDCSRLADGRHLCPECSKTAVMDENEMRSVAQAVRSTMRDKLKIFTDHEITFLSADISDLEKGSFSRHGSAELGRFVYNELTERTVTVSKNSRGSIVGTDKKENVSKKYSIHLLYGMTRKKLIEVAAHELAHDWMQEYYPDMNNLQIQEGWAEYVAAAVNVTYGQPEMNHRIQNNTSIIYGDGYRLIAETAKKGGAELEIMFRKNSLSNGHK